MSRLPLSKTLPLPVVWLGGLLALVLLGTALARWQGWQARAADAAVQQELRLRFDDTAQGDVAVVDTATQRTLAVFSGEQGFLRGTLRALTRERRRQGGDAQTPFVLRSHTDARLVLLDPQTGQRIDLDSFGPSNKGVFASLLQAAATPAERGTFEGKHP